MAKKCITYIPDATLERLLNNDMDLLYGPDGWFPYLGGYVEMRSREQPESEACVVIKLLAFNPRDIGDALPTYDVEVVRRVHPAKA